jgi:protocatechuate 3,4-dioxygenase alpha subunit
MSHGLPYLPETSSQTAGPYVHIGLAPWAAGFQVFDRYVSNVLVTPESTGDRIVIEGRVVDGSGTAVRDALIELWQANAAGRYAHPADEQPKPLDPAFQGWGRATADLATGVFRFETVKPGSVIGRGGRPMAPHVNLWIVARGINMGLHTRMYFSDEVEANAADPVLQGIEWEVRRATLIGQRQDREGGVTYRFDIHLQGDHETVFFDI